MPNLSKSIEINGKYFCLDEKTGDVLEVSANFKKVKSKSRSMAIEMLIREMKGEQDDEGASP